MLLGLINSKKFFVDEVYAFTSRGKERISIYSSVQLHAYVIGNRKAHPGPVQWVILSVKLTERDLWVLSGSSWEVHQSPSQRKIVRFDIYPSKCTHQFSDLQSIVGRAWKRTQHGHFSRTQEMPGTRCGIWRADTNVKPCQSIFFYSSFAHMRHISPLRLMRVL